MDEKRRVILVGSAHPLRGGLASFNERLVREFNHQGLLSSIYTFSLQYPGFLFPGKTQYSSEPAPGDLEIKIKVNSVNPLNWIKVGRELKRLKPDLVVMKFWMPFMAPCLGTIARIARKNKLTKVIAVIDNIIPHEKRPGDVALTRYWVNSVDGFICMSNTVLEELKLFNKNKPQLFCPHPIYDNFGEAVSKTEAKIKLGLDKETNYALFFGFIRDYKGLDLLIAAFGEERIRKKNLKLIVAGEFYSNAEPYLNQIRQADLQEKIILRTDFIPDSEVRYYFSACDVVVQPYKTATQSGVTQIAYHFEKPMITTNVGGLSEIVPDQKVGFVVNPAASEISGAIERFYDENRELEFITQLKTEKEKFSWKNMVKSILTLAGQDTLTIE